MTPGLRWCPVKGWRTRAAPALGPPDPYLVWAQLSDWAHFGLGLGAAAGARALHSVPLLVALKPDVTVQQVRAALQLVQAPGTNQVAPAGAGADTGADAGAAAPPSLPPNVPSYVPPYVPPIYGQAAQDRFLTMWVDRDLLADPARLQPLRGLVARIEMAAPVRARAASAAAPPPAAALAAAASAARSPEPPPALRGSVLMGVIDTPCPFGHPRLNGPDGTRVAAVWSPGHRGWLRGKPGFGGPPQGFEHGHAVSRRVPGGPAAGQDLDDWLRAQPAWPGGLVDGVDLALQAMPAGPDRWPGPAGELRRLASRRWHGAAVVDALCGPVHPRARLPLAPDGRSASADEPPTWAVADDAAADPARSDLVFVDLPSTQIHDSTGGWLGPHVLDGLRCIMACADAQRTRHIVANISYGGTTGPHDGSGILDEALAALCDQEPRLHVVMAAGNSFDQRLHAVLQPAPGAPAGLTWQVPPGSEKPAFLELWLASADDAAQTDFTIVSPTGTRRVMRSGQVLQLQDDGPAVAWAVYLPRTSRGRGALLLLALAPTDATRLAGVAEAPHGPWRVQADCRAPVSPVQAWVARNDLDRGTLLRGRPSTLVDERDDPSRWLRGNGDDPGKRPGDADPLQARSGSVLRRRGSVLRQGRTAGRAAGAAQGRIHVVAGYVLQSGDHAPYSAAGDADSPHLAAPTAAAVSDQSRVLPGLRVAGAHGAVGTRLVGTSLAAPLYARDLINRLAAAGTGPVLPPRPWRPTAAAPVADEDDLLGGAGRIPLGP